MSTTSHTILRQCPECGRDIQLGEMACSGCHTLLYKAELNSLSSEAQALESASRFAEARELWNRALMLLPYDSTQAQWVREHVQTLGAKQGSIDIPAPAVTAKTPHPAWVKKFGPLDPLRGCHYI